jgi:hypothetical protein
MMNAHANVQEQRWIESQDKARARYDDRADELEGIPARVEGA